MMLPFFVADWLVIAAYLLLLVAGGWIFTPRKTESAHDYFLAGGNVPAWLAALSVLSATQSAATFLGGPDYGYRGDLTYLTGNIGALIGAIFVAHVLIPRFYAIRATTAYELLTMRFSERATRWAGGTVKAMPRRSTPGGPARHEAPRPSPSSFSRHPGRKSCSR